MLDTSAIAYDAVVIGRKKAKITVKGKNIEVYRLNRAAANQAAVILLTAIGDAAAAGRPGRSSPRRPRFSCRRSTPSRTASRRNRAMGIAERVGLRPCCH